MSWFTSSFGLYNHALSTVYHRPVRHWHWHSHLCTPLLATELDISITSNIFISDYQTFKNENGDIRLRNLTVYVKQLAGGVSL